MLFICLFFQWTKHFDARYKNIRIFNRMSWNRCFYSKEKSLHNICLTLFHFSFSLGNFVWSLCLCNGLYVKVVILSWLFHHIKFARHSFLNYFFLFAAKKKKNMDKNILKYNFESRCLDPSDFSLYAEEGSCRN